MKLVSACLAVLFLASAFAYKPKRKKQSIKEMFIETGIPASLNVTPPDTVFEISIGGIKVDMGNFIAPEDTVDIATEFTIDNCYTDPSCIWAMAYMDDNYHGVDPVKQPECMMTMLLGLFVNVRVSEKCEIISREVLAKMVPHATRPGTGLHRYSLWTFKQGDLIDTSCLHENYEDNRLGFSLSDFAIEHKLQGPVCGNYFETAYPDFEEVCDEICEEQNEQQNNKYKSKRYH